MPSGSSPSPLGSDPIGGGRFIPGQLVAERYRIVALAGRGGMGEVYRAEDLKLSQIVAIKFLPESVSQDASALARFHSEVRIARQVSHPNVCRVFDIGDADGITFLTMEYVDGEDLASLVRRIGRLSTDKATEIARQTVSYTHLDVYKRQASDTAWITERAKSMGFDLCGVTSAGKFPELAQAEAWLAKGYAGEMNYLADARRSDPKLAFPGTRSVIVCALNYNAPQPRSIDVPKEPDVDGPRGWISRYAWGTDYHDVLRTKLNLLLGAMRERFDEPFEARAFADTGPMQERIFAKHAGLGWLGKNTLLLNQAIGSWFFLGAILTTLELNLSLIHI